MTTDNLSGVFLGNVLLQQKGSIGGSRSVFVKLQGSKNELVFPTFGGIIKNIKAPMKFYAGDLFEYRPNDDGVKPELFLLRTFKVKSQSATLLKIYRDGYKHIPFVGDVLMKAPDTIGGKGGQASKVVSVKESVDGEDSVWEVTTTTAITCSANDVLVEAQDTDEQSTGTMLVKNINAVAPNDNDCLFAPVASNPMKDFYSAKYAYVPALGGIMYINKMSPMPKCVLKLNKCNVNGWFKVGL